MHKLRAFAQRWAVVGGIVALTALAVLDRIQSLGQKAPALALVIIGVVWRLTGYPSQEKPESE